MKTSEYASNLSECMDPLSKKMPGSVSGELVESGSDSTSGNAGVFPAGHEGH